MNSNDKTFKSQQDTQFADSAFAEIEMRQFRNEELAKVFKAISRKVSTIVLSGTESLLVLIQSTLKLPSENSTHRS